MDENKTNEPKKQPGDEIFFAPMEDILAIERVIDNLEAIRKELQQVIDRMTALCRYS